MADGDADYVYVCGFLGVGLVRIFRNLEGIVRSDGCGVRRIVRDEDGGEVLIGNRGPLEGPLNCVSADDAFAGKTQNVIGEDQGSAVGGGVVVVVDAAGGIRGGSDLVAESGWPRGEGSNFAAFVGYGGFDVHQI